MPRSIGVILDSLYSSCADISAQFDCMLVKLIFKGKSLYVAINNN